MRALVDCQADLLLHFVGSGDTKRTRMTKFMDSWDTNREIWERPLERTGLQAEIGQWWQDFAKKEKRMKSGKE